MRKMVKDAERIQRSRMAKETSKAKSRSSSRYSSEQTDSGHLSRKYRTGSAHARDRADTFQFDESSKSESPKAGPSKGTNISEGSKKTKIMDFAEQQKSWFRFCRICKSRVWYPDQFVGTKVSQTGKNALGICGLIIICTCRNASYATKYSNVFRIMATSCGHIFQAQLLGNRSNQDWEMEKQCVQVTTRSA